jgi:transmembrane sensor
MKSMSAMRSDKTVPSAAVRAEAAVWMARLHGPNRTREVETGFRRWLSEDPERAAAFELMTDIWENSARLRRRPSEAIASLERPGFRLSFSRATLATFAIAVVAAIGTAVYLHTDGVTTGIGEQRTLALEDGTRVYLNTNSRAVVHYDKHARRVDLEKGEALFEVAKRPDWPFIVTAGDRQVRALGTAFDVRRDAEQVAVTLVEGKVTVSPVGEESTEPTAPVATEATMPASGVSGLSGLSPSASKAASAPAHERRAATGNVSQTAGAGEASGGTTGIYTLAPGQRLTFAAAEPPKLDQPSIERVTAWQRSQVVLDDTPLEDAVAEMNRYNTTRLTIDDTAAKTIRVSGVFRAGDSDNFAQAVAKSYDLKVTNGPNEIILSGASLGR